MANYNADLNTMDENQLRALVAQLSRENADLRGEIGKANTYLGKRNNRKAAFARVAAASRFWMRRAQSLEGQMRAAGLSVTPVVNASDGTHGASPNDF